MFVFYSIAICFKLQAIFMFPFLIIIYMVKKKFSILYFLWIPFIYLIIGLPCVFLGKGKRATYGMMWVSKVSDDTIVGH